MWKKIENLFQAFSIKGADFSRNITTNLEIHGEFAFINSFEKKFVDSNGNLFDETIDAKNYLAGIRYLTSFDTTFIWEYYRDGTGFTTSEMKDFFAFVDKGYDIFILKFCENRFLSFSK